MEKRVVNYIYEPKGRAREYAPLALNIWTGCPHGCRYCYAPRVLHAGEEQFADVRPRKLLMPKLLEDVYGLKRDGRQADPVHLCFVCDPYPRGYDHGWTSSIVDTLGQMGQAMQVLTKNPRAALVADRVRFLRYNVDFGVSLSWNDDAKGRLWEPGAASANERVGALQDAKASGIRTWVSVEPVIEPAEALSVMRRLHRMRAVDHWKVGKLEHCARDAAGVDWAGFAREVVRMAKEEGMFVELKASLREALETGAHEREGTRGRTSP